MTYYNSWTADDLPRSIGGWERQKGASFESRDRDNPFGADSRTWQYRSKNGLLAVVSFDYPFPEWHDLRDRYQSIGWNMTNSAFFEAKDAAVKLDCVKFEIAKPIVLKGYGWFTEFDQNGKPILVHVPDLTRTYSDMRWSERFMHRRSRPMAVRIRPCQSPAELHGRAPGPDACGKSGPAAPGSPGHDPEILPPGRGTDPLAMRQGPARIGRQLFPGISLRQLTGAAMRFRFLEMLVPSPRVQRRLQHAGGAVVQVVGYPFRLIFGLAKATGQLIASWWDSRNLRFLLQGLPCAGLGYWPDGGRGDDILSGPRRPWPRSTSNRAPRRWLRPGKEPIWAWTPKHPLLGHKCATSV